MNDYVESQGLTFLAAVLRRVSDELVSGETEWRTAIGIASSPRTSSTLYLLHDDGPKSLTEIARKLRQSHQLVLTWVKQLKELGMVQVDRDPADARKTVISLSDRGIEEAKRLRQLDYIEEAALRELMTEADADVFDALWRLEKACRDKPFGERLLKMTPAEQLKRAGNALERRYAV